MHQMPVNGAVGAVYTLLCGRHIGSQRFLVHKSIVNIAISINDVEKCPK